MAHETPDQPLTNPLDPSAPSQPERWVQVWTPDFPNQDLTYKWPPHATLEPSFGLRVIVPLRKRKVTGYIVALHPGPESIDLSRIRTIEMVLDPRPMVRDELAKTLMWAADYYLHPLGAYLHAAIPPGLHALHEAIVRITPIGKTIAAWLIPKPHQRLKPFERVLIYLAETHSVPVVTLKKRLNLRQPGPVIQYLKGRGWVTLVERVRERRGGTRVPVLHLVRQRTEKDRLSKAQAELLDDLAARNRDVPVSEIANRDLVKPDRLRRLERRGFIQVYRQIRPRPFAWTNRMHRPITLNAQQQSVLDQMRDYIDQPSFHIGLLYGVTGSGKTEVYLRLVEQTVRKDRSAIVLMPEIALLPSVINRFHATFGRTMAVLHSGLSDRERVDEWLRIQRGQAKVVLGTRSSVFAPLPDIGLLVVDEEQDSSYKQRQRPAYNAKDVAMVRAHQVGCPILLVSATPSIESYARARSGRYKLYTLSHRAVPGSRMPSVSIIDMRKSYRQTEDPVISSELQTALAETLDKQECAIILINRRGYAPSILCKACGESIGCPSCSVRLVYHREDRSLLCHTCGFRRPVPHICPRCGESRYLASYGLGTEKVVRILQTRFPNHPVDRMDSDVLRTPKRLFSTLQRFQTGEIRILVGTQMVAKGHHFPLVTLVGVLEADAAAGIPDFRAAERLFQLISQVIGRAGREEMPGRALIQTFQPDYYALSYACKQQYEAFFHEEMAYRQRYRFPPFSSLAVVTIRHKKRELACRGATQLVRAIEPILPNDTVVHGPVTPLLTRMHGLWRYHVLLRTQDRKAMRKALAKALQSIDRKTFSILVDVDPDHIV